MGYHYTEFKPSTFKRRMDRERKEYLNLIRLKGGNPKRLPEMEMFLYSLFFSWASCKDCSTGTPIYLILVMLLGFILN